MKALAYLLAPCGSCVLISHPVRFRLSMNDERAAFKELTVALADKSAHL